MTLVPLEGGVDGLLQVVQVQHVFDKPGCDADELYKGFAVLIPKVACVLEPKQTRPVVLTETVAKLAARVAVHRVLATWWWMNAWAAVRGCK